MVGVAQTLRRPDPAEATDPVDMMIEALRLAADDSGGAGLVEKADSVRVAAVLSWRYTDPGAIVTALHAALRPTRGAAVAIAVVDLERGVARYSGLGNIVGVILGPGTRRHSMVSQNGTAGHTASRIQGECNKYGQSILVSGEAMNTLGLPKGFVAESTGTALLRGKEIPVELFTIRQLSVS